MVLPVDPSNPTGNCTSGIAGLSGIAAGGLNTQGRWLVGDVFLKNAYYSTNVQANTLSLAKLV